MPARLLILTAALAVAYAVVVQPVGCNLRDWADGDLTHTVVTLAGGGHGWLAIITFVVAVAAAAAAPGRFRPTRIVPPPLPSPSCRGWSS